MIEKNRRKEPLKEDRRFHWAWIILVISFLNLFTSYSIRLGYGVVLPEMIRDMGFSRTVGGTGMWTPLYGTGAILSHWMGGVLRDAMGNYDDAFTINAVMAGIAILLFSRVKKGSSNTL